MAKSSLEELGDAIGAIVDQAISSQNFQKLNQTIQQAVSSAVDTGSGAIRRAMDEAQGKGPIVEERRDPPKYRQPRTGYAPNYQPNRNPYSSRLGSKRQVPPQDNLPVLYQKNNGKLAGGIVKTVFGGLATFTGSSGLLASVVVGLATKAGALMTIPGVICGSILGTGIWLLTSGIHTIGRVSRFEKYLRALGDKTYCEIQQLARAVGKPQKFVQKEIKGMIEDGMFVEGHLDNEETSLITSDDTFVHYLETQRSHAVKKQQEIVEEKIREEAADKKKVDSQVQEVLDKGNAFLREIRRCNDAIPGEEISEKIYRMELIVRKIFDRAESHPEIVPDLKKLMDYYLPMTVKLLNAYADMDSMPMQGDNIRNSKKEIEATLDTLNTAFEKLLDSVFKETAMDISSDITVLQTLLAQEGLTEDEFSKLKDSSL